MAEDMKALHSIKPEIEERYLHAAWAVHRILDGHVTAISREFRIRQSDGYLQYRRINAAIPTWSNLSLHDVNEFATESSVRQRGHYEARIKEFFRESTP